MSRSLSVRVLSVAFLIIFQLCGNQVEENECGTTNCTLPLVAKGTQTHRGEWPFLTALYLVEGPKYQCGGTLISSKHVLTGTIESMIRAAGFTISLLTFQLLIALTIRKAASNIVQLISL